MPDKQNDNKFMSMLERAGIVRKTDSENDSAKVDPVDEQRSFDTETRPTLDNPSDDSPKVTPAARQPVPGLISPTLLNTKPQPAGFTQPAPAGDPKPEQPRTSEATVSFSLSGGHASSGEEPGYFASPSAAPVRPASFDKPAPPPVSPSAGPAAFAKQPEPPPAENYTNRYLDIDELYERLAIRAKKTDTIYLVEEYMNTLPDSLPDESRREIVTKLIAASDFDFDHLMGDGVLRVRMLKEYAEQFARYTDEYVTSCHTELSELEQQMLRVRKLIDSRKELHKKQFYAIEAEAQRLKEILTFLSG